MNEVTKFMYYMYNRWSHSEAILVFGNDLGEHVFNKWSRMREDRVDTLYWYSELDNNCRQKLVDRANEIYH